MLPRWLVRDSPAVGVDPVSFVTPGTPPAASCGQVSIPLAPDVQAPPNILLFSLGLCWPGGVQCFLGRNSPGVETFVKAAKVRFFSHFGASLHVPCVFLPDASACRCVPSGVFT